MKLKSKIFVPKTIFAPVLSIGFVFIFVLLGFFSENIDYIWQEFNQGYVGQAKQNLLFNNNTKILRDEQSKSINHGWLSKVIENIKKQEYEINWQPSVNAYQSPNRAQNLRFTYYKDGFSAKPRTTRIPKSGQDISGKSLDEIEYETIEDWEISLKVVGVKSGREVIPFKGEELKVEKNYAEIEDKNVKIEYINNEEGMRQNFVIKENLGGERIEVLMKVDGTLKTFVGRDAVAFRNKNSEDKMYYRGLKVWDSEGKDLVAYFSKWNSEGFSIVVNTRDAVYPIVVDPLSTTANWTAESNQADARFGVSVSTAGDVNGDGYSDVIVGARLYDNGETDEGIAFVYYGSASGLSTTANWTAESNQVGAQFGYSVSTAGDVNGDGYSDVIVGANLYDNGQTNEGAVFVYYGSASGLSTTANWTAESDQVNAQFGFSVSTAGDVNGDGYSDVIVGAYLYDNGQTDEGAVFVYYGNGGTGTRKTLQQYKPLSSVIVGPHGMTGEVGEVRFGAYAKSPFGRAKGKLVWEYKPTGQPFSGASGEGNFVDLGTAGTELTMDISGITTGYNYRWRVRTKYSSVNNPYQVYSPWRYYEVYQPLSFGSFKAQDSPLPVELLFLTAEAKEGKIILRWQTVTEINNYGYEIERELIEEASAKKEGWTKIGFISGSGNSNSLKIYSFEDKEAPYGRLKYRLKQIDIDGSFSYSSEVEIINKVPKIFSLKQNYPNPFNPITTIEFTIPEDGMVELKIYDILGREIETLIKEELPSEKLHRVEFDGSKLASGIYFYRLESKNHTAIKKFILMK